MDTSATRTVPDRLGRRSWPRRQYTTADKRAIVEETRQRGAAVATVAHLHGINAKLVFGWRRLHQQGLLEPDAAATAAPLLPVRISTPTVVATKPAPLASTSVRSCQGTEGPIYIEFAGGIRVCAQGEVYRATAARKDLARLEQYRRAIEYLLTIDCAPTTAA